MAITNKSKEKNPVLEEIENDDTPIDAKGKPIVPVKEATVEDLLKKAPDTLTAEDMDILSKNKDDLTDQQKVTVGLMDAENLDDDPEDKKKPDEDIIDESKEAPTLPKKDNDKKEIPNEDPDQKEQRYKAQQAEVQIQAERNRSLTEKVSRAREVAEPTTDELKAFVKQDGVEWDELTTFEQSTAKRTYLAEKRFSLIDEAVATQQKSDEWVKVVDDFIDTTDGKPEFLELSGHEAEFRKFSMKESHRGTPVGVLLGAFLHQLPPVEKKRGGLFESGGGGEKSEAPKDGIVDADTAAQLRTNNPREYKRQVKAGKIKLDV